MPLMSEPNPVSTALATSLPILRELAAICEDLRGRLSSGSGPGGDVPKRIVLAFLTKATHTLRAILLLYDAGLCHEAQSLIRVAFEVRITFDAFLALLKRDPRDACHRVVDSMMLEKIKQQRASGFKGHDLVPGAPSPADLEKAEEVLANRYGPSELAKLRKHGFSGMNVEQRARQSQRSATYDIVYRNFSRNVHSSDFMELLMLDDADVLGAGRADYVENRDEVACNVAFDSCAFVAGSTNDLFRLGRRRKLLGLVTRWKQL